MKYNTFEVLIMSFNMMCKTLISISNSIRNSGISNSAEFDETMFYYKLLTPFLAHTKMQTSISTLVHINTYFRRSPPWAVTVICLSSTRHAATPSTHAESGRTHKAGNAPQDASQTSALVACCRHIYIRHSMEREEETQNWQNAPPAESSSITWTVAYSYI